jgi:ubiquinone/menaquinone biosynthesis C-methylase UbiE
MQYRGITIPSELFNLNRVYDSNLIKKLINFKEPFNNQKRLVNYEDFKNYLIENIINKYKTKRGYTIGLNALQLQIKRFTNYVDINSNKQFITLYTITDSQLNGMLNHFVGSMHKEIIMVMIKNNISDTEILDYIKIHFKFKNTQESKEYRNSKIASVLNHFYLNNRDNVKLLDLGVGDGKKIKSIVSYFKNEYKLYGTDIEYWGPYKKDRKLGFPFKFIQMKPYKIPYDDKMFDCIFIILTLHHTENIIKVLEECYRILKDDGCIVLVEHDVWTDDINMLIDLQHRIYSSIFNETSDGIKATYYNYIEWDIIFNKCGFKYFKSDIIQDDNAYTIRYDMLRITLYCKKNYNYKLCINI